MVLTHAVALTPNQFLLSATTITRSIKQDHLSRGNLLEVVPQPISPELHQTSYQLVLIYSGLLLPRLSLRSWPRSRNLGIDSAHTELVSGDVASPSLLDPSFLEFDQER
jgi:hypothetical protein